MLTDQIFQTHLPSLKPHDKVFLALQLMNDYDLQHLPIVIENKFEGLINKDELLDADSESHIQELGLKFFKGAVKVNEHYLVAVKLAADHQLSMVPVIDDEGLLQGCITLNDLIHATSKYLQLSEPGGLIVLRMERKDYSFGEINRLVETNDVQITQLNSFYESETGMLLVTLKLNKFEISDVVATFQRFDYEVKYYFGDEHFENELKENFDNLMSYLKV
jgi:acetoin utilization protein AcuB